MQQSIKVSLPPKENLGEKEVVKLQPSDLLGCFRNVKFHTFLLERSIC